MQGAARFEGLVREVVVRLRVPLSARDWKRGVARAYDEVMDQDPGTKPLAQQSGAPIPDVVAWQPPHLEKPILISRRAGQKKPMHPALVQAGVAAFAIGIAAEATARLTGSPRSPTTDFTYLGAAVYGGGPVLIVAGVIILAIAANRKAWLSCIATTLLATAFSLGSTRMYIRITSERDCYVGNPYACVSRAQAAFSAAEAAPFDKRACERSLAQGCKRWDRDDPTATANETFEARCNALDYTCLVAHANFKGYCKREPYDWECN
jgi:hypothetical protein